MRVPGSASGLEEFAQVGLDLAHRHATGVHRDDLVVEASEAAFVLADQLRLKAPLRSRGTSMLSAPSSVKTVLPLLPLRWLATPTGFSSPHG
jgi:hypothetical protein